MARLQGRFFEAIFLSREQSRKAEVASCRVLRCVLLQAVWDLKRNEPYGRAAKTASLISAKGINRDSLARKSETFIALERINRIECNSFILQNILHIQVPQSPAFASSNKCKAHIQGTPLRPRLQAPQAMSICRFRASDPADPADPASLRLALMAAPKATISRSGRA